MSESSNALAPIDRFNGDFEWLPVAAQLRYGRIPVVIGPNDFQSAAVRVSSDLERYAEAHWYLEAMRERRLSTRTLDEALHDINVRVAKRLYSRSQQ